jgi:uncharacterized protein
MRFWDTSALVPLLVAESASEAVTQLYRTDPRIVVAWTTTIECTSAFVRRHRERLISDDQIAFLLGRLDDARRGWNVAEASEDVRSSAERMVARHGLRAADAIQLASAIETRFSETDTLDLVCLDRRLALAAVAEGLRVVPQAIR